MYQLTRRTLFNMVASSAFAAGSVAAALILSPFGFLATEATLADDVGWPGFADAL